MLNYNDTSTDWITDKASMENFDKIYILWPVSATYCSTLISDNTLWSLVLDCLSGQHYTIDKLFSLSSYIPYLHLHLPTFVLLSRCIYNHNVLNHGNISWNHNNEFKYNLVLEKIKVPFCCFKHKKKCIRKDCGEICQFFYILTWVSLATNN